MESVVMEIARTETGFCCVCELLPGWIVTGSNDIKKFKEEVQESINFYIDCAKEDNEEYPKIFDSNYMIVYKFNVQSFLEFYRNILSFSALEVLTGINQKQLAHYAAGRSKPRPQQAEKITNALHKLANDLLAVNIY